MVLPAENRNEPSVSAGGFFILAIALISSKHAIPEVALAFSAAFMPIQNLRIKKAPSTLSRPLAYSKTMVDDSPQVARPRNVIGQGRVDAPRYRRPSNRWMAAYVQPRPSYRQNLPSANVHGHPVASSA